MLSKLVQVFCRDCGDFQFWKYRMAKDDPKSIKGYIVCEKCLDRVGFKRLCGWKNGIIGYGTDVSVNVKLELKK